MNLLEALWGSPLIHRFGCGLLHFLWQGLLIAMIVAVALRILRGRSAGARYLTAWTALLVMALSVPITAWLISPPPVTEPAGAAAELPGVGSAADSAGADPGAIEPYRIEETRGPAMAPTPAVPVPVASPALGSSEFPDGAEAATGDPLVVRASQWIRPALPWVVCCWIVGAFALSVWRLSGWMYLRRLCHLGTSPASDAAGQMLERLLRRLRINRAVQLLESTLVEVPTVIGWLRPVILLPASILGELPAEQLELILAHELAHIRRHDYLLNLLQTAIETLLFYHPAVWWVSRRIGIEREACCDDLAVAGCGDRLLYARALTRLEELRHEPGWARVSDPAAGGSVRRPATTLPASLRVAADGAPLPSRIRRVLGLPGNDQQGRRTWLGGSVAVLLLIGALVGYVATAGEPRSMPAQKGVAELATQPGEETAAGPSSTSSSSIPEWGEAVEGVQVRLRTTKSRWNEGRTVRLWAHVRNQGTRSLLVRAWGYSCEVEVDGEWYRQSLRGRGTIPAPKPFPPGRQYDDIAVDLRAGWELKTSQEARRPRDVRPEQLKLTGGKHTIRVAFTATAAKNAPGEPVRAVSNPVVIEVISAKEIAARPKRLKSQKNAFELRLAYHRPRNNPNQAGLDPIRSLILHTTLVDYDLLHGWSAVAISEEQAARIIDHLQVDGSLVDALPFPNDNLPRPPDGPTYSLTVKGPENLVLYKPVGWGLGVLDFLERLRTVLDGEAAQAVDRIMAALGPQRKVWEAVAKWGQAVEGVQVRLRVRQSRPAAGPQFYCDIRNLGTRTLLVYRAGNFWTSSELEIDGRWYRRQIPEHGYRPPLSDLVPGRQFDNILVYLRRGWYLADSPRRDAGGTGVTESQPGQLKLAPGKHTIRVAPTMPLKGNRPGDYVKVISNAVEIEIVATPPAGGAKDRSVDPVRQPGDNAGPSIRLTAKASKRTWRINEQAPRLDVKVEVPKPQPESLMVQQAPSSFILEVDGKQYEDHAHYTTDFTPITDFDHSLYLDNRWRHGATHGRGGEPLELTPGKHTIRVSFRYARAVSDPIEIEIVTDGNQKVGAAPGGSADRTTAEPRVEATGAKPDDRTTSLPPVNNPAETAIPPVDTSGAGKPAKPRFAGQGLVIDDATGKPVEQIAIQEGVLNAGAPSGIMWITAIQSPRGVAGGRFSVTHGWVKEGKVRIRIVADGYLPEVAIVDTEDGLLKAPLVMRLRRGAEIRGRVIDHAGKPVAGAEVFLGGPDRHVEIVDGKTERFGGKRETTDASGRFVIRGAAPGEVHQIVVLAPGLHVWTLPVLELGKELSVKLPEPATLVIRYDIPGDVPEGRFRLQLKTGDMPDWKGAVSSVQNPTAKNQGEVVLKNMTPGIYDVIRMKQLRVEDFGTGALCDRRDVTLESGKTTTLQFIRKKAYAIEGDVVGLEGTGILGAFVYVRSPKATGDPESRDDWKLPIYDGTTSAKDGKFKTAPIEPGEYLLVADAYEPQPRGMGFGSMGWSLPAYLGKAKVTVPEDGPPPRVRIEMKPRAAGRKAPPAAAPPKTSAGP